MGTHVRDSDLDEGLRLYRVNQILDLFPFSRSTLYRKIEKGEFPKPRMSGSTPLWRAKDLHRFVDDLPECEVIEEEAPPPPPKKKRDNRDLLG